MANTTTVDPVAVAIAAAVKASEEKMTASVTELAAESDVFYLLICSVLVFMMQAGFAMLEAGVVREKNVRNILTKNMVDACLGGIIFWVLGYGLAYGGSEDNGFFGSAAGDGSSSFFFSVDDTDESSTNATHGKGWIGYMFQYCFAAAATTIVSGSVAGRCSLIAYLVYSTAITGIIYPVVVHWVWDSEGWISAFNADATAGGMMDFAGSGVVHMTGGVAGLVGAALLGPRLGRFDENAGAEFHSHSAPLQSIGTMLLWAGWYGFNCGSTLGIHTYSRDAARVAVTTTLSACGGGIAAFVVVKAMSKKWDFGNMCNGILGGLVGITAGCSVVEPWAALLIGLVSGVIVIGASTLLVKLKIDDPLDAFPVHGACGFWGCLAVGLFCTDAYGYNQKGEVGLFYGGGALGAQLLGLLVEVAWVAGTSGVMFFTLKQLGVLRVTEEVERDGLDIHEHESKAYSGSRVAPGGLTPLTTTKVVSVSPAAFNRDAIMEEEL